MAKTLMKYYELYNDTGKSTELARTELSGRGGILRYFIFVISRAAALNENRRGDK